MPHKPAIDIEKLKAGDGGEWERAWRSLHRVAKNVVEGYHERIGDLLEDDFIIEAITKAHEHIQEFNSFDHLRAWLTVTTRHAIRDELDRQTAVIHGGGNLQSLEEMQEEDSEHSHGPGDDQPRRDDVADEQQITPDQATHLLQLSQLHEKAFEHVDNRYANVVRDFYFERLTQGEIAKKRGLAIGSIGAYLDRGLDALRKHMPDRDKLNWWHKMKGTRNGKKIEQAADDYAITPHLTADEAKGPWRRGS